VLGLALDVHLNAIAFMPLVGLVYVAQQQASWRDRLTRLFMAGVALGAAYYVLVRVMPDLGQFSSSYDYWIGQDKRPPILDGDLHGMVEGELGRFGGYFTDDRRAELAALLAALAFAGWRAGRRRYADPLLLGLAAAFVLFVLLVSGKSEFYVVLFYPWLMLLLAGLVVAPLGRLPWMWAPVAVAAAVAAYSVFGVEDNQEDMVTARENFAERGYYALIDEIRPLVPPGASVLGPPLFWIGLSDHPYTDYFVWERLRAQRRERFASYAARLKPDVIVLDAKARHQVQINSPGFLESSGVLLKSIKHVGFERVEVWKLS
jgi:hypothetical protein